jgi:hypothetical protein
MHPPPHLLVSSTAQLIVVYCLLGTSLRDTYVMYPYHESHENRVLGSPKCRPIRYLITMRICMRILCTKVHVESGREYLPHGNLMPLILRTKLLSKPNGNDVAIVALSTVLSIPLKFYRVNPPPSGTTHNVQKVVINRAT